LLRQRLSKTRAGAADLAQPGTRPAGRVA
jgi:hypothetical protein